MSRWGFWVRSCWRSFLMMPGSFLAVSRSLTGHNSCPSALVWTRLLLMKCAVYAHTWEKHLTVCVCSKSCDGITNCVKFSSASEWCFEKMSLSTEGMKGLSQEDVRMVQLTATEPCSMFLIFALPVHSEPFVYCWQPFCKYKNELLSEIMLCFSLTALSLPKWLTN